MAGYKEIFAKYGYALHEPESLEGAIVDALRERNLRYLYGIPILLERSKVDYPSLIELARKAGVLKELREVLFIAAKIVKGRKVAERLRALAGNVKKPALDTKEFRRAYDDYRLAGERPGFPPSLSYHLSFLFARKQIGILYKLKGGERLTKTEKEYFSRTIKKKLAAIRELAGFAKDILGGG